MAGEKKENWELKNEKKKEENEKAEYLKMSEKSV